MENFKHEVKQDDNSFFASSCRSITLIPSVIKELVIDALNTDIRHTRNLSSHSRGNVQHRLGGVISKEDHLDIVSRADYLIENM